MCTAFIFVLTVPRHKTRELPLTLRRVLTPSPLPPQLHHKVSLPCVADFLAPLLHLESWRTDDGLGAWALSALAALPMIDGAPDAQSREKLLAVLSSFPDACADTPHDEPGAANGASYSRLVAQLAAAAHEFGRVARRLAPSHAFVAKTFDWSGAPTAPPASRQWVRSTDL